jgi:UDP-3-O-[3-hydroxymyristoyl] glucosamine N-acyltransferase
MKEKFFTLAELAQLTQSKLVGNPHHIIKNVADLESAEEEDASFLAKLPFGQSSRYDQAMQKSTAGVIFVHPEVTLPPGRNFLIVEDPSRAFQQVLEIIYEVRMQRTGFKGIHPTAVIHESAKIGQGVTIGPHAVIDENVSVGDHTSIGAGSYIGLGCKIGIQCTFHSHVTVREHCIIGNRVILQPGAVIGSCGFGYTTNKQGQHEKLNQIGNVVIEDDVEIGANTTIDRGRFKSTKVGKGSKIDNLVQVGHGVSIGQHNMIIAQTGLAGSSKTGRYVVLAGQCGITGHIRLEDGVILSARTGADKSLKKGTYGGAPAMPMSEFNRMRVHLRRIETYVNRIMDLEARLAKLENVPHQNRI